MVVASRTRRCCGERGEREEKNKQLITIKTRFVALGGHVYEARSKRQT